MSCFDSASVANSVKLERHAECDSCHNLRSQRWGKARLGKPKQDLVTVASTKMFQGLAAAVIASRP